MTITIAAEQFVGFLLALVRTSAWLVISPPFNSGGVNNRVRAAFATGLALLLAPSVHAGSLLEDGTWAFAAAALYQAFIGVVLGFTVMLVFLVVQAAGELLDMQVGFSLAQLYDPFTNATATPIGRLYQLVALAMLFAINGHVLLVQGFLHSFDAAPLSGPSLGEVGRLFSTELGGFVVSALEIAAPLLAALFLTEIALGLVGRAAPQLNIMVVGFAVKILIVLVLLGSTLTVMPDTIGGIVGDATRMFARLLGG